MVSIMDVVWGMLAGWVFICVYFAIQVYLFSKELNKRSASGAALNEKLNPKPVVGK